MLQKAKGRQFNSRQAEVVWIRMVVIPLPHAIYTPHERHGAIGLRSRKRAKFLGFHWSKTMRDNHAMRVLTSLNTKSGHCFQTPPTDPSPNNPPTACKKKSRTVILLLAQVGCKNARACECIIKPTSANIHHYHFNNSFVI